MKNATKKNGKKAAENTVLQMPKRHIKSSPAERDHKIVAYVQAALYNARKIGNKKKEAALTSCLNQVGGKKAA